MPGGHTAQVGDVEIDAHRDQSIGAIEHGQAGCHMFDQHAIRASVEYSVRLGIPLHRHGNHHRRSIIGYRHRGDVHPCGQRSLIKIRVHTADPNGSTNSPPKFVGAAK